MKKLTAVEKLKSKIENYYHICVGLDTDIKKIPKYLNNAANPVVEFNKIVIENTASSAAAFKINFAFYEKDGIKGIENLIDTIKLVPNDILLIADAKRGDIGNSSLMYAESIYNNYEFDSATLHPYMGYDSIEPFLNYKDKINFILALTSNPGAEDFEKLILKDDSYLFQQIIKKINNWNKHKNCGIVFGATKIQELKDNIRSFDDLIVLLPGVGAQGGSLEDIVDLFETNKNRNYLINISRSLLYCDSTENFPKKIKQEIQKLNLNIRRIILQRQ